MDWLGCVRVTVIVVGLLNVFGLCLLRVCDFCIVCYSCLLVCLLFFTVGVN